MKKVSICWAGNIRQVSVVQLDDFIVTSSKRLREFYLDFDITSSENNGIDLFRDFQNKLAQ